MPSSEYESLPTRRLWSIVDFLLPIVVSFAVWFMVSGPFLFGPPLSLLTMICCAVWGFLVCRRIARGRAAVHAALFALQFLCILASWPLAVELYDFFGLPIVFP
jgi:hypothetical protein